jgi:malate dehydrogenase (oxaloacetate-decarboxylating)
MYFVYILQCTDGSLYTGITTDVARRFLEHKKGVGGHYTRSHQVKEIVYTEKVKNRSQALKREYQIKQLSTIKKKYLVKSKSMAKNIINSKALAIHKKLRGKISVTPKAPLKNKNDLNLFYTPGVGAVSSYVANHKEQTGEYTMKSNTVAVISDGSAVLGLGNLGPEGALPVMEGKAMLFKALAGVDAFPIVLATQDTDEIVKTIINIAPGFGGINLEDISAPRCFEIEKRLQQVLDIPVFHDDQHGTAMVVLAGLINALKVVKKNSKQCQIVISGAGAAGQAIADILLQFGVGNLIMVDSQGIISKKRKDLDSHKKLLLKLTNKKNVSGDLSAALVKSDVFIGVSKAGTLTREHIKLMEKKSVIFALANPVPEIMPDDAKKAGAAVIATGRSDFPNQINNSLGFPGIFRGALDHKIQKITDTMLIKAAHNLASIIKNPTAIKIIPDMFDSKVVKAVSKAIQ